MPFQKRKCLNIQKNQIVPMTSRAALYKNCSEGNFMKSLKSYCHFICPTSISKHASSVYPYDSQNNFYKKLLINILELYSDCILVHVWRPRTREYLFKYLIIM